MRPCIAPAAVIVRLRSAKPILTLGDLPGLKLLWSSWWGFAYPATCYFELAAEACAGVDPSGTTDEEPLF
jgi:hypothetical protein